MDFLPLSFAIVGGFFFGTLVLSRVLRWIQTIQLALKPRTDAAHSTVAFPLVLFLHSGPWVLLLAFAFAFYVLGNPHRPEWVVFFLAALASQAFMMGYTFVLIRRHQKKPSENGPP